jgi:bifunctional non-homologous end joining protein LigD
VAPFSCRVRPGAPVAWPLAWEQLSRLKDARPASVLTAPSMIRKWRADPWEGYFDLRQTLPTDLT